jgi:5'-3' exonuclease
MFNHEEADSLLIRHAYFPSTTPDDVITVHSPDTDVFVLFISYTSMIQGNVVIIGACNKVYHISSLSEELGEKQSKGLFGLHAFTECDTTGKFKGRGKSTWMKLFLDAPDEIIDTFCNLGEYEPIQLTELLEAFVCRAYCRKTTKLSRLADAR